MGHPLDPKQAFFYGQFVQAAYTMFKNPGADPLRPEPAGIPDGWEVGAWIHMSDFILNLKEPQFYGIVVHGKEGVNDPQSRIIAIRGTEGWLEWFDDAFALHAPFSQVPDAGKVARGFDTIYRSLKVVKRPLPGERELAAARGGLSLPETFGGSFSEQLDQLATIREATRGLRRAEGEARPPRPTVVTGHSLGGALTTLFVMEDASKKKFDITTSCTFASPRVGNTEFVRVFNQLPIDSWRIVNTDDEVPRLPLRLPLFDYQHVDTAFPFASDGFAKHSLVCCHAMETYLHWLDGAFAVRPECRP